MRLSPVLGFILALVAALVCVRLGFWQLARLEEKRALNREQRAALANAPAEVPLDALLALPAESLRVRRVVVHGTFDPRRHLVLVSRARDGEPGVEIVTPLRPNGSGPLVLVDRGFLPSADGATVVTRDVPDDRVEDAIAITGFVERLVPHGRASFLRRVDTDSIALWQAPWLDADSLSLAFGEPVHPLVLRELPGPGVPASPARALPVPFDESLHLNYAVQWFSFAGIIAIGSLVLFARSRRAPRSEVVP
jgi:surfeit locus 1 family protein